MEKFCLTNSLIGDYFNFYLSNTDSDESRGRGGCLTYQMISPGLAEDHTPLIGLYLVSSTGDEGSKNLLTFLVKPRDRKAGMTMDEAKIYLEEMLNREDPEVQMYKDYLMPMVKMKQDAGIQKSMIINLRDAIRWRRYRFQAGAWIDILWTGNRYAIFDIVGDDNEVWLEPRGLYNSSDPGRINNLGIKTINNWPREKFSGKNKASDMNRAIKKFEWGAFPREPWNRG